jgi:Domain of unknown function (DU1801)
MPQLPTCTTRRPRPFDDPAVEAVFESQPPSTRRRLLRARELIFLTAAETVGVGEIGETLRWGDPAYLTPVTRSGSTIRLNGHGGDKPGCAVYLNCHTDLVQRCRDLFPTAFEFEGNRLLVIRDDAPFPEDELRACFAMALTYHVRSPALR